ncbi:uncharacterized protein N7482_006845 [Penicillium canariense]|uniref:Uncharacterized protein n=1 Tax=Penicillium canariense TaxID=189055 RepID=A0A9W9LK09_9EURO|nr:uncharacterized protein N7482_006845 [Penicillium canariense]KAJ5159841.1 hypothetical protein N7482_006845 [Penicillium canariense]
MSGNERRMGDSTWAPPSIGSSASSKAEVPGPSSDGDPDAKSRRRRRGADAETQPKKQSFYFVDSTSSSKEKRAHVMRHHVQEKRKQRKLSHGSLHPEQLQEARALPARNDSGYDTDKEAAMTGTPGPAGEQISPLQIRFSTGIPYAQQTVPLQMESPVTMLDASRRDPFSSLPMLQDPEDMELVDYWTTKLTYWSGQNSYVKNQIFRTAMEHPFSFQAVVLVYCARYKAQLYGLSDSKEVRRHVGQAKKNIEDAVAGSLHVHDDQLAMALAGLALSEERYGSSQDAHAYLDHAVRIMRQRVGANPSVEVFLHYMRCIMPAKTPTLDPADRRWLVTFLQGAQDLMQMHSASECQPQSTPRRTAFQMESPLFSLLSSGPRPSQVPHASRIYVVHNAMTQEVSRTAALIYITAALWDFKDSDSQTQRFLVYLCALVEQHQLDRYLACETLLWLLLEQGCDPDLRDPERAWSTGALHTAHWQLPPDLQFHFNEMLMSFLSLRPPIRGIGVFQTELQESFDSSRSRTSPQ